MYTLNDKSKGYIRDIIGLSFEDILEMNSSDIDIQNRKKY